MDTRSFGLLFAVGLLAACGSPEASSPSAMPASAAATSAGAQAVVVVLAPVGEVTCTDMDQAASHFKQDAMYASLNLGTINDSVPTYQDMGEQLGVMLAAAPACTPDAVDEIDALVVAAQASAAAYRPGDAADDITAQQQALMELKDAGVAAWSAMGKDAKEWDLAVKFDW